MTDILINAKINKGSADNIIRDIDVDLINSTIGEVSGSVAQELINETAVSGWGNSVILFNDSFYGGSSKLCCLSDLISNMRSDGIQADGSGMQDIIELKRVLDEQSKAIDLLISNHK